MRPSLIQCRDQEFGSDPATSQLWWNEDAVDGPDRRIVDLVRAAHLDEATGGDVAKSNPWFDTTPTDRVST
jgi:hypothetical protein